MAKPSPKPAAEERSNYVNPLAESARLLGIYLGLAAFGVTLYFRYSQPDVLGTVLRAVGAYAGAALACRLGLTLVFYYLGLATTVGATPAGRPAESDEARG